VELGQIREWLDITRLCVLSVLLVIVVYTDLSRGKVYNWCTLGGLALAIGLAVLYWKIGPGGERSYDHISCLWGILTGFTIMFIFYMLGGIKFADVKLMTAVGALLGYPMILLALVMTAMAGAITAFAILIWKGRLRTGFQRAGKMLLTWKAPAMPESLEEQEKQGFIMMPYGFAIAVGTLAAIFYSRVGGTVL
jgi:prepilin peptidase CpaA